MQLKKKCFLVWLLVCLSVLVVSACQSILPSDSDVLGEPTDPYDYNYCGGVPVYPVIGVSFSTFCGPRNQIAVGRYGTLMWLFPEPDGSKALLQGTRQLSVKELKHLSLLAEVVHLADPLTPQPGKVNYQLGINFPGRANKPIRGVLDARYSPAKELFEAMLELVPGKPALPECNVEAMFFDPIQLPGKRKTLTLDEIMTNQGYRNVPK